MEYSRAGTLLDSIKKRVRISISLHVDGAAHKFVEEVVDDKYAIKPKDEGVQLGRK